MSDAGGQITHLGVIYQDKIAALYLGRMLDPRFVNRPADLRVVEVRGEKPGAEVDDVYVRFADEHSEYIQAKTALQDSGDTWEKLWEHFYKQHLREDFGKGDRLVLLMGDYAKWYKDLKTICQKASSSTSLEEWQLRHISKAHEDLAKKLAILLKKIVWVQEKRKGQPPDEPGSEDYQRLYTLLSCVDLRFIEHESIVSLQLHVWMPGANVNLESLFSHLCFLVTNYASEGCTFEVEGLRNELERLGVEIKPLEQQSKFTDEQLLHILEKNEEVYNKKNRINVAIFAAVILVIGACIVGYLDFRGIIELGLLPFRAGQTTEAIAGYTITPSITSTQTQPPTKTPTLVTPSPTPVTPSPTTSETLFFADNCINSNNWEYDISVSASHPSIDDNGCIDLTEWGFAAKENELIIDVITTKSYEEFSIYTPVIGATEISFKFQITKFNTGGTVSDISFGVVPINDRKSPTGKLLFYQVVSSKLDLEIKSSESDDYEVYNLEKHPTQLIEFLINEYGHLVIKINENVFQEETKINFEDKAFIIMYNLPKKESKLTGVVSEFMIEKQ